MEFCDLTIEVARHEALPQQLHAMHLRLGAASAVVSAPLSPDGAAEVFRRAQRFVPGDRAGGRWFPGLGILARWDDGVRASVCDRVMALARVVSAVRGNRSDLHIRRNLVQQFGQHRRITDATRGDLDGADFQRLLVHAEVDLAP